MMRKVWNQHKISQGMRKGDPTKHGGNAEMWKKKAIFDGPLSSTICLIIN